MRPQLAIQKTVYKVSDFLGWQRDSTLVLSPSFQRRPVWKPIAKSFLIDTIVRGFPVPVLYIRERVDLDTQRTIREVVDGQQRLRTIISFVAPDTLSDFDSARDDFTVRAIHNSDIEGRPFARLPAAAKASILGYEFSTHILSSETDDRDILQMFSRINSTGTKLNPQELRNAEFFGEFKLQMYRLAVEQLDRWRHWGVFAEDQIARMKEVEMTSDLVINFVAGITAKRQPTINKWYGRYDDEFPHVDEVVRRFQRVFDELDDTLGHQIRDSVFSSEVLFFSLVLVFYDALFELRSPLSRRKPSPLPASFAQNLLATSDSILAEDVPADFLDAIRRAPVDVTRRTIRHNYLRAASHGTARR